jgi:hypothetical protein
MLVAAFQRPGRGDETPFKCLVIYDTREYLDGVHIDLPPEEEPSIKAEYNRLDLHWLGKSFGGTPAEFLGSYQGRGIYQRTWPATPSSGSGVYQPFQYTIFYYQTEPDFGAPDRFPDARSLFPFFVCNGLGVRNVTHTFASYPDHPFTLNIRVDLHGQGLLNSTYRFGFTKHAVYPIDCSSSGRQVDTTVRKF